MSKYRFLRYMDSHFVDGGSPWVVFYFGAYLDWSFVSIGKIPLLAVAIFQRFHDVDKHTILDGVAHPEV